MLRFAHIATLSALLAAAIPASAHAQDADGSASEGSDLGEARFSDRVSVAVETAELESRVGDHVAINVTIDAPAGWQLLEVRPLGNRFVERLDEVDAGSQVDAGRWVRTLTLTIFRPGRFAIDALRAEFLAPDGTRRYGDSAPISIAVASTISNETDPQPAPNDPPMPVRTLNRPLIGAAIAIVLLGIGALLATLWRRRQRLLAALNAPPPPPRPAHEVALEKLALLEQDALIERGEFQEFHTRLSEILREFLGSRIGAGVLEMTTAEISALLAERQHEVGSHADSILTILGEMDLVKFARFAPSGSASVQLFDDVRGIVLDMSARERELAETPEALSPSESALPPVPPETPEAR